MHDAIFLRYPELYSPTYCYAFTRSNRSACRRADLIIAISEQTKRDYMDFFGVEEERIRVVYQGCNDLYWQPIADAQLQAVRTRYDLPDSYVLSVGALEERKNHKRIIEALADAHIELPLVLVGKGNRSFRQQLSDTARRYGIELRIIDNACTEELPALYRMASVFVYPSLFEGFGIPVLEAARCGTPVVASSGICFDEITADGALYADPLDAAAIGKAISDTLYDCRQTQERVQKALKHTEKFHAQRIIEDMMHVYRSLV
jgi:glycosyltransferase involved in cell wall biosynthesis